MYNNDYDMDEEFSMEAMPSLKTYNIPKKHKSKELLTNIKLNSREAINLRKEIMDSMWDSSAYSLDIIKMQLVNNTKLEKMYAVKRNEMKEQRSDITESFAYIRFDLVKQRSIQNQILENGLSTKLQRHYLPPSRTCCIGDDKYGVYLCRCADVLSRFQTLDKINPSKDTTILVCKYMKGKLKAIANQSNQLEPTPDFDAHCSQLFQHGKKLAQDKIYDYSQLYLYEIDLNKMTNDDSDSIFEERPRQCIPYATVTFRAVRKVPTQPQPQLSMTPQINGNSTIIANASIINTQNTTSTQSDIPSFDYAMHLPHIKFIWRGHLNIPKRRSAQIGLCVFSQQQERCPLDGLNILYVTQAMPREKLSKTLPTKIFRKPPCLSLKPIEEVQGFQYMHAEIHPPPRPAERSFLDGLHSNFIKTKLIGVCVLNSGLKVLLLPSCELTDRLGITVPGYPPILHCVFMRRINHENKIKGAPFEKFIRLNKAYVHVRLTQFEELKRTNKAPDMHNKRKYAFSQERCDLLRTYLIKMYETSERRKGNLNPLKKKAPNVPVTTPIDNTAVQESTEHEANSISEPLLNSIADESAHTPSNAEKQMKSEQHSGESNGIILLSSDEDELVIDVDTTSGDLINADVSRKTKKKIKSQPSDYCCEDPQCRHGNESDSSMIIDDSGTRNNIFESISEAESSECSESRNVSTVNAHRATVNHVSILPNHSEVNHESTVRTSMQSTEKESSNVEDMTNNDSHIGLTDNNSNNVQTSNIPTISSTVVSSETLSDTTNTHSGISTDTTNKHPEILSDASNKTCETLSEHTTKHSAGEVFLSLLQEMKKINPSQQPYHQIENDSLMDNCTEEETIANQIKLTREQTLRSSAKVSTLSTSQERRNAHSNMSISQERRNAQSMRGRSRSPYHHSSRSSRRYDSYSPRRQYSRSPRRRLSRSPHPQHSRSPRRHKGHSPRRQDSHSTRRKNSRSPVRESSHSPVGRSSTSTSPSRANVRSTKTLDSPGEHFNDMQSTADKLIKVARHQSGASDLVRKLQELQKKTQEKRKKPSKTMTFPNGSTSTGCDRNSALIDSRQTRGSDDARFSSSDEGSGVETWIKRASDRLKSSTSTARNEEMLWSDDMEISSSDDESRVKTSKKQASDRLKEFDSVQSKNASDEEPIIEVLDVRLTNFNATNAQSESTQLPAENPSTQQTNPSSCLANHDVESDPKHANVQEMKVDRSSKQAPSDKHANKQSKQDDKLSEKENKMTNIKTSESLLSRSSSAYRSIQNSSSRYRSLQCWADTIDFTEIDDFERGFLSELALR